MKSVITALGIFILIITLIVISYVYTDNITLQMLQSLYKNENNVAKNNWDTAQAEGEKISLIWDNNRNIIVTMFSHTIIERVDECISKMNKTVQMQEKEEFFYESARLRLLLESLVEQQEISIGNVL